MHFLLQKQIIISSSIHQPLLVLVNSLPVFCWAYDYTKNYTIWTAWTAPTTISSRIRWPQCISRTPWIVFRRNSDVEYLHTTHLLSGAFLCKSAQEPAQITYPLLLIVLQDVFQYGIYSAPIVVQGLADQDVRHQRDFVITRPQKKLLKYGHMKLYQKIWRGIHACLE